MSNAKAKQDRELTDDAREKPATIVPFAPMPKGQVERNIVVDDSGRAIVALLQKAAEMAKDDCARAMDLAHKLSFQLRAAEEGPGSLKRELHIFAIEPPVRKHGYCAFMMKSSIPSFKKRTAIRGKRNASKHLSMAPGKAGWFVF